SACYREEGERKPTTGSLGLLGPLGPCLGRCNPGNQFELAFTKRFEDHDLALGQVAELLAGGILQVRLVADDEGVLTLGWRRREQLLECLGPPLVLAGRHDQSAFGDIERSRD